MNNRRLSNAIITITAILPPVGLGLTRQYRQSLFTFAALILSLGLAFVFASTGQWPYSIWLFPTHFLVGAIAAKWLFDKSRIQPDFLAIKPDRQMAAFFSSLVLLPGLAFVIFTHNCSSFIIASASMAPNLLHGDYAIVRNIDAVNTNTLRRGDIVVFRHPGDNDVYIKRIVGLPGDHVEYSQQQFIVNGKPLARQIAGGSAGQYQWLKQRRYREQNDKQSYIIQIADDQVGREGRLTVPVANIFVAGDNRNQSHDSRAFGPVPFANIIGRPLFIWWSVLPIGKSKIRWSRVLHRVQ
jgi:signal peptidase I